MGERTGDLKAYRTQTIVSVNFPHCIRRCLLKTRMLRLPNSFKVVKKHLKRLGAQAWFKQLKDPRSPVNRIWTFDYILEVLYGGMLSGCKTLRAVETFSEIYDERIPDTTLHDVLVALDGRDVLRQAMVQDVKTALRSHELPKAAFPVRVTAIDGKSTSVSNQAVDDYSGPIGGSGEGQYRHMALRALHISDETPLFLGQYELLNKSGEATAFIPFVTQLHQDYGQTSLLDVFSVDAGMTSIANTDYLIKTGYQYIMALKGPQQTLFAQAQALAADAGQAHKVTVEHVNGKQVTRELWRFPITAQTTWTHLKEIWRIKQTVVHKASKETMIEERFFLTSLAPSLLTEAQVLKAIRAHWRIENNGFWILDTAFGEDDHPWTNYALAFITRLRLMAYNFIARLMTRRLRREEHRALSRPDVMTMIQHAYCQRRQQHLATQEAVSAFIA